MTNHSGIPGEREALAEALYTVQQQAEEIQRLRKAVAGIRLAEEMVGYIVDLVRASREHPSFQVGASPRTSNMLASASRALAVLSGRDFVIPDDVKFLWKPALRHRVLVSPGTELEGVATDQVLGQVLDRVPAPR